MGVSIGGELGVLAGAESGVRCKGPPSSEVLRARSGVRRSGVLGIAGAIGTRPPVPPNPVLSSSSSSLALKHGGDAGLLFGAAFCVGLTWFLAAVVAASGWFLAGDAFAA